MNKLYIKYGRMTKFSSVNSLHWGKTTTPFSGNENRINRAIRGQFGSYE